MDKNVIGKGRPIIILNDDCTENLSKIMSVNSNEEVDKILSIIFSKLGFKDKDKIDVSKIMRNAYDLVELEFQVNHTNAFKVIFHRRYGRDCLGLMLTDTNKNHYAYKCNIFKKDDENFDVKMMLKGFENNLITCKKNYDNLSYSFFQPTSKSGKIRQIINFEILCSDEKKNASREYLNIKNEKSLVSYLSNCKYPLNLSKVYEDIKELCFEGDVSHLLIFNLNVITILNQKNSSKRFFSDGIVLKCGQLDKFWFSHIGRLGDSSKNYGGVVEFVPAGLIYSVLHTNGRLESLGFIDDIESDVRVSRSLVDTSALELIRLFPKDAERLLPKVYGESELKNILNLASSNDKQYCSILGQMMYDLEQQEIDNAIYTLDIIQNEESGPRLIKK